MKHFKISIILIISLLFLSANKIEPRTNKTDIIQTYKFVLTHMLGKKLTKPAYFYVGNKKVWVLDFRNGDKIYYSIVSMNPDNPMCGIAAKDNFGDTCDICITKTSGDNTKVEFKYYGKRVTYSGYFSR